MAMKGNSTFPKALGQEPHHQMEFSVIPRILDAGVEESYPSAEIQLAYFTAPANKDR